MRAIAYIRVSTDKQGESGISLEWQKRAVLEACAQRDWEAELVVDTVSGKNLRRPGLQEALSRLASGQVGGLVVSRLDRLSRSTLDFYDLLGRAEREGWTLVCLSPNVDMTDPMGRAMAGVAAVFAQFEREMISLRQRESVEQRKRAGTYRPPQPKVSDEAVTRILSLKRRSKLSAERICERLTLEGVEPPAGAVWHPRSVRRIIERHG